MEVSGSLGARDRRGGHQKYRVGAQDTVLPYRA